MLVETFRDLVTDKAHWEFEIFLQVFFDGLLLGVFWKFVRAHWKHHIDRDKADKTYRRFGN